MNEIPEATATAAEIHHNFRRKMAKGGPIDHILAGDWPAPPRSPESDAEIALRKKQIQIHLDEYTLAMNAALAWHRDWKERRRRKGFRCKEYFT